MTRPGSDARASGDLRLVEWAGPVLALAVSVFCFGVLLSRLGFFQDDWHHVFYAYWQGAAGLRGFLLADRGPFAWPVYAGLFRILGFSPAAWHWALMVIRYLTILCFWLATRHIWPRSGGLASWIALIFCIYPIFTLQPLAVAYTLHWTMFLLFMLSLLSMMEAEARPRLFVLFTAAALVLEVTHLALIEYFSGLEIARPVFLWLVLADLPPRERLRATTRRAWPYILVLVAYAIYRSSFAALFGYDRFQTLTLLGELIRSPLAQARAIVQVGLQDLVYILLSQWYSAVEPSLIDLTRSSTLLILIGILGFAALAFMIFQYADRHRSTRQKAVRMLEVAGAGLLIVILSMLPFWLTGFSIYQKNQLWSERLALAAMPGASMLVVGLVHGLVDRPVYRNALLSLLLGIGVGMQAQTARLFQASWDKQRDLYWQLSWRAPSLRANTLLIADQEILFFMGIYPTAFALNVLYPQVTQPPEASYWFNAGFEHINFDRFAAGTPATFEKYTTVFTARANDAVAITFEPGDGQCLWVLRPELGNAGGLTDTARTWMSISQVSNIQPAPVDAPPSSIFGPEPRHSWCYFFEKADLALQFQRWDTVRSLWSEAAASGQRASSGVELVPFIEAAARQSDWSEAYLITRQAQSLPDRSTSLFCDVWRDLAGSTSASTDRDQYVSRVQEDLGCQPWQ